MNIKNKMNYNMDILIKYIIYGKNNLNNMEYKI